MKLFITIILTVVASAALAIDDGYYWRDYTSNNIPMDAFIAGTDRNGDNIYIGQVDLQAGGGGLVPAQINPKKSHVYAELIGPKRVDKNIKILCGNQDEFEWSPTSYASLEDDVRGKFVVFGGHEVTWGNYLIGRVKTEKGYHVGKIIVVGWDGKPAFYIIDKDNRGKKMETEFEFLLYKNSESSVQLY